MLRFLLSTVPFFAAGALAKPAFMAVLGGQRALLADFLLAVLAALTHVMRRRARKPALRTELVPAVAAILLGARHVDMNEAPEALFIAPMVLSVVGDVDSVRRLPAQGVGEPMIRVTLRDARVIEHDAVIRRAQVYVRAGDIDVTRLSRVRVTGMLSAEAGRVRIDTGSPDAIVIEPSILAPLSRFCGAVRAAAAARYDELLSVEAANMVRHLVLGIEPPEDPHAENRRRTGAQHFFAVSGFHLSLIAALLLGAQFARRPPRSRLIDRSAIFTLVVYAVLVGGEASVIRALAIALLGLHARARRVVVPVGWLIIVTAALLILLDPDYARSLSFQLSLAAVAGLEWLARPLLDTKPEDPVQDFIRRKTGGSVRRFLRASLVCSLSVLLTTGPITMIFFSSITPVSLLTNIILAPLIALTIGLGLLVLPFPFLAYPLCGAVAAINDVLGLLARVPWGHFDLHPPAPWAILAYALLLAGAAAMLGGLGPPSRYVVVFALTIGLALSALVPRPFAPPVLRSVRWLHHAAWLLVADGQAEIVTANDDPPPFGLVERAALEARRMGVRLGVGARVRTIADGPTLADAGRGTRFFWEHARGARAFVTDADFGLPEQHVVLSTPDDPWPPAPPAGFANAAVALFGPRNAALRARWLEARDHGWRPIPGGALSRPPMR